MRPTHLITSSLLAVVLASCASQKSGTYDTSNPYGVADAGQANPSANEPANPVYETPAVYEESSTTAKVDATKTPEAAVVQPNVSAQPEVSVQSHAPGTIHVVVAGDTLSRISAKYKVPIASIKKANHMTNDVVVLGRKMVIPAH